MKVLIPGYLQVSSLQDAVFRIFLYIIRGLFAFQAALRFRQKHPEYIMFHTGSLPLWFCFIVSMMWETKKNLFCRELMHMPEQI